MKKFKADYILPVNADPIKNGLITVNDDGMILAIEEAPLIQDQETEIVRGVICPGFINTHCHLELSHLRNKIAQKKGLIQFIKDVQQLRHIDQGEITSAAEAADQEMYDNGIVAVGDISNSAVTALIKGKSKLYYHTFIETFGFTPENAEMIFNKALGIAENFASQSYTITPHAPYSVSKDLFKLFKKHTDLHPGPLSIHNQESEEENKLFRYKTGEFLDLYESFGVNIDFFKPQARNSLQSVIPLFSDKPQILLVHNTFTNLKDIYFVKRFDRRISWCFCPSANMYIENKLPKIDLFLNHHFNYTLGTDSLASNTKLSILNEMFVLQQNFPKLDFNQLLKWATINGAKFLGIDQDKGSLELGKTPGLNVITGLNDFKITADTQVKRLI
jgi:cytosine/adenosine deaminase-related metal-dependent hydrolase